MGKSLDAAIRCYMQASLNYYKRAKESSGCKKVHDSNIWMVRTGCIIKQKLKRRTRYLLGRLEKQDHDLAEHPYRLKTPGGYLRLAEQYGGAMDTDAIQGMLRESHEEGFRGRYRLKKLSLAPSGVIFSPEKGMLQFYVGELMNYPEMGLGKEEMFWDDRGKKVLIKWCGIQEIVRLALTDDSPEAIPSETAMMLALSYVYEKSRPLYFGGDHANKSIVSSSNELVVPQDARRMIVERSGLNWIPRSSIDRCVVHYNTLIPKNLAPEMLRFLPPIQAFFRVGPFLHQVDISVEDIKMLGLEDDASFCRSARVVRRYIQENYEKIIYEGLLGEYLIDKGTK